MHPFPLFLVVLIALQAPLSAGARPFINYGDWPESWPKELDPLRDRSNTIIGGLFTEPKQDYYDIPLESLSEFEQYWPSLLKVRSKGSPISVGRLSAPATSSSTKPVALVRIYVPPANFPQTPPMCDEAGNAVSEERTHLWYRHARGKELSDEEMAVLDLDSIVGELRIDWKKLQAEGGYPHRPLPGPPWPESILEADGTVPECVQHLCHGEAAGECEWVNCKGRHSKHCIRARIEIELRVDERVIDVGEIEMPADAEIIDKMRFGF
jgi:hypothetical protein